MSGGGGSSGVQKIEPPSYQLPYLTQGLSYAQGMLNQGAPKQYQGSTVVPFSQQSQAAMAGIEKRATAGSPLVKAAQNYAAGALTASPTANPYAKAVTAGQAANPYANAANPYGNANNPYLASMFKQAAQQSQGALASEYARSGRNIQASQAPRAEQLNNLATQIYGGAYDAERNRQLQYQQQLTGIGATGFENQQQRALQSALTGQQIGAGSWDQQQAQKLGLLSAAPGLAAQDYLDLGQLQGVGSQVENLAGQYQQDAQRRFDYEQQAPQMLLDQYLGRVRGTDYGSTTRQSGGGNTGASILGGAATGAALGSAIPGVGTAIGAGIGGLLGLF